MTTSGNFTFAPNLGELVINAFANTDLAKHLAATGRKNLIVGGFMTHMCVSATVRSATDHGYMSTVAAARSRHVTCPMRRAAPR